MSKKEATKFLHWLYRMMRQRNVIIRLKFLEEDTLAEYVHYLIDDTIDVYDIPIDPSAPLLPAIIHEGLHVRYPDHEEEEIERLTTEVCEKLTTKQYHNLLCRLKDNMMSPPE